MHQHIENLKERAPELVSKNLYTFYKNDIRACYTRFESLRNQIEGIISSDSSPIEVAEKIHDLLEYNLYEKEGLSFTEFAPDFYNQLENLLEELPTSIVVPQSEERFYKQKEDMWLTGKAKSVKRFLFNGSDLPRRFLNIFRKQPKPKTYWSHRVPLQAVAKKHLLINYISSITPLRRDYLQEITKAYTQLLIDSVDQKDSLPDPKTLQKELSRERNLLKTNLIKEVNKALKQLEVDAELAGTIELKVSHFSDEKLSSGWESTQNVWRTEYKQWNNTLLLLHEEWRSDLELRRLTNLSAEAQQTYETTLSKIVEQAINPDLEQILKFIEDANASFEDAEDLSLVLKATNYKAQKNLDEKLIPALVDKLGNKNILNAVARLENTINQGLKAMSFDLRLSKSSTQYQTPTPTANITSIPLYELIAFEIAPSLFKNIDRIKAHFLSELGKQITLAGDLDHMIAFGLTTAIQQLEESGTETALTVASEAMLRARERVLDIKNTITTLFTNISQELSAAISTYNKELEALMVNENIRDMRLRIAKAKTIQQTKAYRHELINKTGTYLNKTQSSLSLRLKETNNWISALRQRFFLTSKKQSASRSVSDFLSGAEDRINSLPVIYKNLYKAEPLTDQELFVGRTSELQELSEAYHKWSEGKMGSVILYGEKLSGMTSLLNYLQSSHTFKHPITRIKCKTTADSLHQLREVLSSIVSPDEVLTIEQVQEKLLNGPKRVVILEDIQNLYLRKTGGFIPIKTLLKLISHTSKNVFWTTSCTHYTLEYFKKTINLQEIFSYHIALKKPTENQLSEIVQKRNRVSGYKIHFEAEKSMLENKRFSKLTPEEQQEVLRKRFFKNLMDFSESNISMALMYWLLSTKSIDQNQVVINAFQKPDLSFLEILSMEKIMGLNALILHDGLTLEQFATVTRKKHEPTYLLLSMLVKDGILIQKDDLYVVNTLVYRNVIRLLKAKNLIY